MFEAALPNKPKREGEGLGPDISGLGHLMVRDPVC